MKHLFISFIILCTTSINVLSQISKVGINTQTPTEALDVKETLRVRTLRNDGEVYTDASGIKKTFTAATPIVNSTLNNIVGSTDKADLVANNKHPKFTTLNDSEAMFVIKRFKVGDWPSQNGNLGISTGMSSKIWEAVMSNVSFNFVTIQALHNIFNENHLHSWSLFDNGTEWHVWGDINGVQEKTDYLDILFIKKHNVATENRTNLFPY